MNRIEQKYLKIFMVITKGLDKYPAILAVNTALNNANEQLKLNIIDILNLSAKASEGAKRKNQSAYTNAKKQSRDNLNNVYEEYMGKLGGYLRLTPDENAPREYFYTASAIGKATGADILLGAAKIYTYSDSILPALAPFGIDATLQTKLQTATDAFKELVNMPNQDKGVRKDKRQEMKAILDDSRRLVQEDITAFVRAYSITDPFFFNTIMRRKRVGKLGTRLMALRVWVVDAEGKAVVGATVLVSKNLNSLTLNPSPKERDLKTAESKVFKRKTGEKGVVQFQHLPYGKMMVEVHLPNGDTKTTEVIIKKGERVEAKVEVG